MKQTRPRIAVLGAGIMGSCAALFLARAGCRVTLVDAAAEPVARASRWNEGKIHLGHLYAADPGLATAQHVLPGSLAFRRLLEECTGTSIAPAMTREDDIYLSHRDSVVTPDEQWQYLQAVDELVRSQAKTGDYLVDVCDARSERLTAAKLASLTDSPEIVAGFRTPERSVSTTQIAALLRQSLATEEAVSLVMDQRVTDVRSTSGNRGPWTIITHTDQLDGFDGVVNALWEGRLGIDRAVGVATPSGFSHRYRRALFIRTSEPLHIPSALVSVGAFGDIKNFGGHEFYLSWYPSGLAAYSMALQPEPVPELSPQEQARLIDEVFDKLGALLPAIMQIRDVMESVRVEGGWVFAAGQGQIDDPDSSLHYRRDFDIQQSDTYFSIDTGKYSSAPWLAKRLVSRICDRS